MKSFYTVGIITIFAVGVLSAQNSVIDKWNSIEAPAAPTLESVEVDPSVTALLILDIEQRTVPARPRAVAIVPGVKKLLSWARKNDILVVYSTTPGVSPNTILSEVKPAPNEVVVAASVDKYFNTKLEETLRAKGITNVIITGVAAEGAVHVLNAPGTRGNVTITKLDMIKTNHMK
ncbi:MAG: hypothetical protein BKP49_02200 [Treponema sp. CETP13]|nr:MAG: hypothetical protein BKP49_02200 [Treponema sp. CETP13]